MRRALPMQQAGNRPLIDVTIITGFLGSGKTTRLNNLLSAPDMEGSAVIINEFGDVPIDQYFVDLPKDDVVTLANGCLCCISNDDFEDSLICLTNAARDTQSPLKRIFVETSGLADPGPIAQLVLDLPTNIGHLSLKQIDVTVDAEHMLEHLENHVECRKQVGFADRLLFTKSDRVDDKVLDRIRHSVLAYNDYAEHCLSIKGALSSAQPLEVDDPRTRESRDAQHAQGHSHSHDILSHSFVSEVPIDWQPFSTWFRRLRREHGERILRAKGVLYIQGEKAPVALDAIHHVAYPPRPMPGLAGADGISRLVFIVQGLSSEFLREQWESWRTDTVQER